ncbi:MAG: TonB C-terminal domain-containing protein [Oligoflexia bacterium]|nr:TonB C-terminal domain-containing protein [Oligoflexia bacterium]
MKLFLKSFFKSLFKIKKNQNNKNVLILAFSGSIALHLLLLMLITNSDFKNFLKIKQKLGLFNKANKTQIEKKYIKLSFRDKSKIILPHSIPNITPVTTQKKIVEKEKKKEEKSVRRQIVNNENTGIEKRPDNSRFLGEKNQSYEKQSIANSIGIFNKAGKGTKDGILDEKEKKDPLKDISKPKENEIINEQEKQLAKEVSLADLNVNKNESYKDNLLKNISTTKDKNNRLNKKSRIKDQLTSAPQITNKENKDKMNLDLKDQPNNKDLRTLEDNNKAIDDENFKKLGLSNGDANSRGLSRNNDFIEDVPLGDITNLNTIEFKHFGFYSRIRERLEQYWGATLKSKADQIYRTGKKLTHGHNYITSLKITIDLKGNIVKIQLMGSSGQEQLDNAAIESFNKAGPFPNPPKDLLKDGVATLEWGFVVRS